MKGWRKHTKHGIWKKAKIGWELINGEARKEDKEDGGHANIIKDMSKIMK